MLDERRKETLSRLGLHALDDRSKDDVIGKRPINGFVRGHTSLQARFVIELGEPAAR